VTSAFIRCKVTKFGQAIVTSEDIEMNDFQLKGTVPEEQITDAEIRYAVLRALQERVQEEIMKLESLILSGMTPIPVTLPGAVPMPPPVPTEPSAPADPPPTLH
jgi:hypothetical protein